MEKDAVTAFERNKPNLGDLIGDKAVLPNKILEPAFSVDGVKFKVQTVKNTEAAIIALIEIDAEKILFASDLAYSKIHLYIAEKHIAEWLAELNALQNKNYKYIFPGHGAGNSPEILAENINYLQKAQTALTTCKSFAEFEQKMLQYFPTYEGLTLLKANSFFLTF